MNRWPLAAIVAALAAVALLVSHAPLTVAQTPSVLCNEIYQYGCSFGVPYPINSSLAAPYIGLNVLEACYTGIYCPRPAPTPTVVPCVAASAAASGHYQPLAQGGEVWVPNASAPGTHLCPATTPTPLPTATTAPSSS